MVPMLCLVVSSSRRSPIISDENLSSRVALVRRNILRGHTYDEDIMMENEYRARRWNMGVHNPPDEVLERDEAAEGVDIGMAPRNSQTRINSTRGGRTNASRQVRGRGRQISQRGESRQPRQASSSRAPRSITSNVYKGIDMM
jgi:hypothetical protein